MFLLLEIVSGDGMESLPELAHVFDYKGGGIGREEGNAWVIPRPASVHRRHANVRFQSGVFFIEKLGDNTVAVDNPDRDIATHDTVVLRDGCRLYLDAYEIAVRISQQRPEPVAPAREPSQLATDLRALRTRPPSMPLTGHRDATDIGYESSNSASERINSLITPRTAPPAPVSIAANAARVPTYNDVIKIGPGPEASRDPFWDPTRLPRSMEAERRQPGEPALHRGGDIGSDDIYGDAPPAVRAPLPAPPPYEMPRVTIGRPIPVATAPSAASSNSQNFPHEARLARLLAHIGIDPSALGDEAVDVLGLAIREALEGVILATRARMQAAAKLGLSNAAGAQFGPNPIANCPNSQYALQTLLTHRQPGSMPLHEALQRAFQDLGTHELGVADAVIGTRQRLLELFEPGAIEKRADETARVGALSSRGKVLWELYTERYAQLASASGDTFRRWYAKEFEDEYEQARTRGSSGAKGRARGGY